MYVWLARRYRHVSGVLAFLDEYQPWGGASFRCCGDGFLDSLVVAGSVGGDDSIVETGCGLRALHCRERYRRAAKGVAATVGDSSGGQYKGVGGGILQSAVLINYCLAADDGLEGLAVEGGVAVASLYFLVEGEDDGTVGADTCGCVFWIRADECRWNRIICNVALAENIDLSYRQTVLVGGCSDEWR